MNPDMDPVGPEQDHPEEDASNGYVDPDMTTDDDDQYVWRLARTYNELVESRADEVRRQAREVADGMWAIDPWDGTFTCDNCRFVSKCVFAFDLYNTNGDCLAEK